MTQSAYPQLTADEQVFFDLIWQPMIKAGEAYLEGQAPVLALPVIKQMDEAAISILASWTFSQLMLLIDVAAIKFINSSHQTAYDHASLELKIVAIEKGVNSDEYKKSRDAAALALSKFTRFGGA